MAKRGRKSVEDLSVVKGNFGERPEPPDDLNDRQRQIWAETVACEPPDFFKTAAVKALLVDYCQRREAVENISSIINGFKPEWIKSEEGARRYHALLRMRDLEQRASMSCATKLRLTNQARYTPQRAGTASRNNPRTVRPWEL